MEIVFAGFGGQGVLTSGLIMAEMALHNGKNVTWMPAYGPSMRGGKAYSVCKFSDTVIGGPDYDEPDVVVAMNGPSLEFADSLKDGGLLVVNTDAVDEIPDFGGRVEVIEIPCTTLAEQVNNIKAANIVTIGAVLKSRDFFDIEDAKIALKDYFDSHGKGKFAAANEAALMAGFNYEG